MFRLLALFLLAAPVAAQPLFPEPGRAFDDTRLPRIDLTLPADTLASILDPANERSDVEYRARFVWDDGLSRDTVEEVGFRLRGNTSRAAAKKSFKVSFNTYRPGRDWEGLDKLNLNGEHNDPSIIRSNLAWNVVREAGVPGSRAGFARLFINGSDFGVYANVEHVDEEFLDAHFRDARGTLFKCLFPANLDDLGTDPAAYRDLAPFGRPVYDLVQGPGDHSDLAAFVVALNRTPLAQLPETIEQHLDVNGYLRALAVDVLTGNWDGYAYNQNNFYLYHDPEIGRFRYIPFDLDNTWGIDFIGRDWGTRNVYDWPQGSATGEPPRPLAKRLLRVPDYRERFTFYLRRTLETSFSADALSPRIDALRALIQQAAEADPYRPLDYGWTPEDFRRSFDEALGGHVDYGLKPYIQTRRATALSQTTTVDIAPLISDLRVAEPLALPGATLTVRAWVEDESAPASVRVFTSADGGAWQPREMTDEGDGVYAGTIGPFARGASVRYYVEARDASGQTRTEPRRGAEAPATLTILTPGGPEGLVINELMASNDATIADEAGEFDDWVEIHNASGEPVSLGGLFLTDDLSQPDRFALPDSVLAPGAFVLVWVDDDEEQGPMHASFNLSASGEDAALFQSDGAGGFTLVSGISFGPQTADISYGRVTDGADALTRFSTPTPEASNNTATSGEAPPLAMLDVLSAAPNPFRNAFTVTVRLAGPATLTLDVYDALGRHLGAISREASGGTADLLWRGALPAGVYIARVRAKSASGAVATVSQTVTVIR